MEWDDDRVPPPKHYTGARSRGRWEWSRSRRWFNAFFCSYTEMVSGKHMNRLRNQISLFSSLPLYKPPKYIFLCIPCSKSICVAGFIKFTCQLLNFCLIKVMYLSLSTNIYILQRYLLLHQLTIIKMNYRSNHASSFIDWYFFFPVYRADDVVPKDQQSLC